MAKKIGNTKKSTSTIINGAIERQNSWMEKRRIFTRNFLKKLNDLIHKKNKKIELKSEKHPIFAKKTSILDYWFPIFCILLVIVIIVLAFFNYNKTETTNKLEKNNIKQEEQQVKEEKKEVNLNTNFPSFDLVRIDKNGDVVIAGRFKKNTNISVIINNKPVITKITDDRGEFVYTKKFKPGNYILSLIETENNIKSEENVFLYIAEKDIKNSLSLLMNKDGSKIIQSPNLTDKEFFVSKIDYLSSGRIVIQGVGIPRLRVSFSLNDKNLGYTIVSDHKNFGKGFYVGKLETGKKYNLSIRLHDSNDNIAYESNHDFIMPKAKGKNNTYYIVRKGDCLWIISRNYLGKGVLFSIIATKNNIKNPNLIYPNQKLHIPIK